MRAARGRGEGSKRARLISDRGNCVRVPVSSAHRAHGYQNGVSGYGCVALGRLGKPFWALSTPTAQGRRRGAQNSPVCHWGVWRWGNPAQATNCQQPRAFSTRSSILRSGQRPDGGHRGQSGERAVGRGTPRPCPAPSRCANSYVKATTHDIECTNAEDGLLMANGRAVRRAARNFMSLCYSLLIMRLERWLPLFSNLTTHRPLLCNMDGP